MSSGEISVHQESSQSNSVTGSASKCCDSVNIDHLIDIDDSAPVVKKLKLEEDKSET